MTKYIKTGTTEFEQFNENEWNRIYLDCSDPDEWNVKASKLGVDRYHGYFIIPTKEGDIRIHDGDWIATGVEGEHWPVKDEIFKKTYKPVWTAKSIQDELAHYGYADLSYNRRVINAIWELFSGENNYDQQIFKTLE